VYDGCIGAFNTIQQQVPAVPFIKANNDLFGFDEGDISDLEELHKSCGYEGLIDMYLKFPPPGNQPANVRPRSFSCDVFTRIQYAATSSNSCFDVYMVNKTCPKGADVMKSAGSKPAYFNRADVKTALHAPISTKWVMCNSARTFVGRGGPQNEGDLSADPIQAVLPKVIQATNRVLLANGDYDMIIITNGTLLSIQNMTWGGLLGFQNAPITPINIPSQNSPAGIQHFERGLMWSEAFKTGHMVRKFRPHHELVKLTKQFKGPEYAPEVALRHIEWVLGKRESL
jgi:carboxypeptidase D